jgi:DUF4097 and DUF4098 domain-containing protein YvlB
MKQSRPFSTWLGLILGACAALLLNVAVARASDDDALVMEEFHQTYPLNANGRVELQNINGAVHITAWDRNEVKVDAIKRAQNDEELKDEEIRVDARADSISIETKYRQREETWHNNHHRAAEVEYTLTVPKSARLDEIKLINGGLDLTGVAGEVHASCINGKIEARGLAGELKLATINGPLDAELERLATSVELSSINGPLHLTLPSDAKATIEATTVHGGIDNNFGLRTNNHRFVGHDLRGELGGGGAHIKLRNVNGTIEVDHASDGHALSPAKDLGQQEAGDEI